MAHRDPGPHAGGVDRRQVQDSYLALRRRTRSIFDLLADDAYYERPIALRHPVVFYEGHIPAFTVNSFLKKGLGHPGIDPEFEALFARGIDPEDQAAADARAIGRWPRRDEVRDYGRRVDAAVLDALESAPVVGDANPVQRRGQGMHTMMEHELLHQETLLYMWHRFDVARKTRPGPAPVPIPGPASASETRKVRIPAGRATLGAERDAIAFGWDNEFPLHVVQVPAFEIDVHNVTNEDFRAFVDAGGYGAAELWSADAWVRQRETGRDHPLFWERSGAGWRWRGFFETLPLPSDWPVWVTRDEAAAYTRWKGSRLATEAEFHRAAYGTPDGSERPHPWGTAPPDETRGNFDFRHWDPVPVGSYPAGASAWGVHDLVGNGWEWTSTSFEGFPGFESMASYPEYSADFFDGEHYVLKGASPATGRDLVRRSFRNWFRPGYPYVYAAFRCVRDAG
ncbi:MAG: SUMF1/EgtB/PvdO family nonheme iron enzyme [Acidobacteria bacterium]|nr:SUMF1/EgtB/PvdO family nonheme iron enzyme [Acidobacteriota bacterium]